MAKFYTEVVRRLMEHTVGIMMSDEEAIKILREHADHVDDTPFGPTSFAVKLRVIADRLEALAAENAKLREALKIYANWESWYPEEDGYRFISYEKPPACGWEPAREALKENK